MKAYSRLAQVWWQTCWSYLESSGWHLYPDIAKKSGWQTIDGGDIFTNESYDNFDLKPEWKMAKDGHSGILFYVLDDSVKYQYPWHTAPEMQVPDNDGHPDAKIIKHRVGICTI